jgi:hypothetical protein
MSTTTRQWLDRIRALELPRRLKGMNVCGGHEERRTSYSSTSPISSHISYSISPARSNMCVKSSPGIEIFVASARTGDGMPGFYAWIAKHAAEMNGAMKATG